MVEQKPWAGAVILEPTHPQERLAQLLYELYLGRVLSKGIQKWLLLGLIHYTNDSGATIDDCLGLTGPGRKHPNGTLVLLQRNYFLLQAVRAVSLDPEVNLYPRCQRLAVHVTELQKSWSLGYRHTQEPSDAWPVWKQHLFRAWRTGRKIPATARGIYEALKKTGKSFHYLTSTLKASDNPTRRGNDSEMVRIDPGEGHLQLGN